MIKTSKRMISISLIIKGTIKIEFKKSTTMGRKMMIIFRIKGNFNSIKTPNIVRIINMRIFRWKKTKNLINSMIEYLTSSIIRLMTIIEGKHSDIELISIIIQMNKTKYRASLK